MKQMNGTVNQIQTNGTWDTTDDKGNPVTYYNYELNVQTEEGEVNGGYLSISSSKENLKFKEGEEIYFEFHDGKYPKIKKPSKNPPKEYSGGVNNPNPKPTQQSPKSDDVQKMIVRQSCLTRAVEIQTHNVKDEPILLSATLELAEALEEWVMR